MKRTANWVYPALVNYKVWLAAVLLALLGAFTIWLSTWVDFLFGSWAGLIVRELGGSLVGIGVIAFAWELVAKRAFLYEILDFTGMSHELEQAGITKVTQHYLRDIDWPELLKRSDRLDIFFSYAQTWKNSLTPDLKEFASAKGRRLRLILPNPKDNHVVQELARRFVYDPDKVVAQINETAEFFRGLSTGEGSSVSVQFVSSCPLFSLYIFDEVAVLTLYSHRKERVAVPTVQVTKGKLMYDYAAREFDSLVQQAGPKETTRQQASPPAQHQGAPNQ